MSLKRQAGIEKVLHVVNVEHLDFALERIEDATALMKLMDKAKTVDFRSVGPASLEDRYDKTPEVRYQTVKVKAKAKS